jgi:hypothetical protein
MSTIDTWVTLEGNWLKTDKLTWEERDLVAEAVKIYWATVCPEVPALAKVPPMDWTPFAAWWYQEFVKRGFDPRLRDPAGKNAAWEILQDLEGRIGIHQGKCSAPAPYCPSYWPFWA